MDSPNRPKITEVDELRGAAALLVFFYHSVHQGLAAIGQAAWPSARNPFSAYLFEGHTGVALFMVLSGYILAKGTFASEINYTAFLRNRFLRIYPLMTVAVIFAVCSAKTINVGQAVAPFLLLANTTSMFPDPSNLAGTVWTASVEFQFYLIAPFLFAFTARKGWPFIFLAMTLFFVLRASALTAISADPLEMYRVSYFTIAGRINQFMIGIGLAYAFDTGRVKFERRGAFVLWIAGTGLMATLLWVLNSNGGITQWRSWRILYPELEGGLWALVIAAYLISRPFAGTVFSRILESIGLVSFSLYILHYALLRNFWSVLYPHYLNNLSGLNGILLTSLILLIPILGISALSYFCIERPFTDMRGKYLRARETR